VTQNLCPPSVWWNGFEQWGVRRTKANDCWSNCITSTLKWGNSLPILFNNMSTVYCVIPYLFFQPKFLQLISNPPHGSYGFVMQNLCPPSVWRNGFEQCGVRRTEANDCWSKCITSMLQWGISLPILFNNMPAFLLCDSLPVLSTQILAAYK
jgi:hypothetical protein